MKVAIVSESSADEAAVRILVEGLLQQQIELLPAARARAGGWPSALNALDVELKHLHYRTDAEALVVVVDSDDAPLHEPAHEQVGGMELRCRLCQIREKIRQVRPGLKPRYDRSMVHVAVGLAVPAIEAWYRCGLDIHVTEDHYARELAAGQKLFPLRSALKRQTYGTERPTLQMEERVGTQEARRLLGILPELEQKFPRGFGSLARDIRAW